MTFTTPKGSGHTVDTLDVDSSGYISCFVVSLLIPAGGKMASISLRRAPFPVLCTLRAESDPASSLSDPGLELVVNPSEGSRSPQGPHQVRGQLKMMPWLTSMVLQLLLPKLCLR